MPVRFKRMIAALGMLVFLGAYVWGAVAIAGRLPDSPLIELLFYAVAGIGWGVPLVPLLRWAERSAEEKTHEKTS